MKKDEIEEFIVVWVICFLFILLLTTSIVKDKAEGLAKTFYYKVTR